MARIVIILSSIALGSFLGYAFFPWLNPPAPVDDPEPEPVVVEEVVEAPEEPTMPDSISLEHLTDQEKSDMMLGLLEANREEMESMDESMPERSEGAEETDDEAETESEGDESEEVVPALDSGFDPEQRFPVVATALHPAEGVVRLIETGEGSVVRYENFKSINGPNLHVYLAKDLNATEYIDLGPIKGVEGNINYSVPAEVDLSEYRYVMYWCVPFGVLFNYADLAG